MIGVADGLLQLDLYAGVSGPQRFGHGGIHFAQNSFGTGFTLSSVGGEIGVPQGYVSRTGLLGNLYFDGQSYASLGLTVGTYAYTWGSGATADSFTVEVTAPTASVPEPESVWLVLGGTVAARGRVPAAMDVMATAARTEWLGSTALCSWTRRCARLQRP